MVFNSFTDPRTVQVFNLNFERIELHATAKRSFRTIIMEFVP